MLADMQQVPKPTSFRPVAQKGATSSVDQRCFHGALGLMGTKALYARNGEIYGQDEPADYVYRVVSGAVRTHKLLDDGRRQIGAFYLTGDIFGLESNSNHRFSAEAVTDVVLIAIKRSTLVALVGRFSLWLFGSLCRVY